MGEREKAGRLPGEVMEVYRRPLPSPLRKEEARDPREIVSVYRQRDPREVVEVYRVPRRGAAEAAPSPGPGAVPDVRRGGGRRGLLKFLVCVAVLVGLAAAARIADRWFSGDDEIP